jgi:CBS domain-containing protein
MITASRIMSTPVLRIEPDKTVLDAAVLMNRAGYSCLLVTSGEDILGIVTERDLVRKVMAASLDPKATKVSEVMSHPVQTVEAGEDVDRIAGVMREKRIRRVAVVEKNKIVGLVTVSDIARALTGTKDIPRSILQAMSRYHEEGY